ncbi:MAG: hypothetical protein AAGE65_15185 [Planctomycetota bacterium]
MDWPQTHQTVEQSAAPHETVTATTAFTVTNASDGDRYLRRVRVRTPRLRVTGLREREPIAAGQTRDLELQWPSRLLFQPTEFSAVVETYDHRQRRVPLTVTVEPHGWSRLNDDQRDALRARGEWLAALPTPLRIEGRAVWRVPLGPGPDADAPALEAQKIDVRFDPAFPGQVVALLPVEGAVNQADAFDTDVETVEENRHYRVTITPRNAPPRADVAAPAPTVRPGVRRAAWRVVTTLTGDAADRAAMDGAAVIRADVVPDLRGSALHPRPHVTLPDR